MILTSSQFERYPDSLHSPLSNNRLEICAGKGYCVDPEFPYGLCSLDVESHRSDPLSRPFDTVASGEYMCNDVVDRVLDVALSFSDPTNHTQPSCTGPMT